MNDIELFLFYKIQPNEFIHVVISEKVVPPQQPPEIMNINGNANNNNNANNINNNINNINNNGVHNPH